MLGDSCDEKFVAEAFGMIAAAEEREKSSHGRAGRDDDLVARRERRDDGAAKFGAVAIYGGVDGVEHFYVESGAFGQRVERISGDGMQARLQMEGEDCAGGDVERFDAGGLGLRVSGGHADETQNNCGKTIHGLGLLFPLGRSRDE